MKHLIMPLSAAALTSTASAQVVVSATGDIDISNLAGLTSGAITNVTSGGPSDSVGVHTVFSEQQGVTATTAQNLNIGSLAAGDVVSSFFFHRDLDPTPAPTPSNGTITFSGTVLGIAYSNGNGGTPTYLTQTDSFGIAGVTYSSGIPNDGSLEQASESITLDGNTITIAGLTGGGGFAENFRVFVAIPEPSSTALLGLGGLALLARRKRA